MFDGNLLIPDWNPTDIRFASAGGGAVRGAVAVCLRRLGPCVGERGLGCRYRHLAEWRQGAGGRAFFARTSVALLPPPG